MRMTIAFIPAGSSGQTAVSGSGVALSTCCMVSIAVSPLNGRRPESSS